MAIEPNVQNILNLVYKCQNIAENADKSIKKIKFISMPQKWVSNKTEYVLLTDHCVLFYS